MSKMISMNGSNYFVPPTKRLPKVRMCLGPKCACVWGKVRMCLGPKCACVWGQSAHVSGAKCACVRGRSEHVSGAKMRMCLGPKCACVWGQSTTCVWGQSATCVWGRSAHESGADSIILDNKGRKLNKILDIKVNIFEFLNCILYTLITSFC